MITVKRVTGVCLQCQWGIYYKGGEGGLLSSIHSNALDISADHHIAMINTSMNTRFSFIYNDNINVFTLGCFRKTLFQKNKKRNPPSISLGVSLNRSKRIFDFDQV